MTKVKELKKVEDIIKHHESKMSGLIGMLQDVQTQYKYLPKEVLTHIAKKLNAPASQVYSLATFYKAFSLKPRGKYVIGLCVGTACHVRGANTIGDEIKRKLKIEAGQTTKDGIFTFETVNCLGACALGPVVVVEGKYYRHMTATKLSTLIEKTRQTTNGKKTGKNEEKD